MAIIWSPRTTTPPAEKSVLLSADESVPLLVIEVALRRILVRAASLPQRRLSHVLRHSLGRLSQPPEVGRAAEVELMSGLLVA